MKVNFEREEILNAIEKINNYPNLRLGRHSSTYDLVFKGQNYPPILVLSLANKSKNGKELTLSDFGNNVEIPFKILRDNGFEIVPKNMSSMKKEFTSFLQRRNKEGSQKASAYLRAIDLLENILNSKAKHKLDGFKSIYSIKSSKKIDELYHFVLNEQNRENGIFQNETPSSYWKNKFYSAALNSYQEFLDLNNINNTYQDNSSYKETTKSNESFNIQDFQESCTKSGLNYSSQLITRYIASLLSKPFIILTGLSGSGKTKLAQAFVQWICKDEEQYSIIPVGADWTNREPLLGYPNALNPEEYVKPDNGVLDLILHAKNNEELPYFLILDEMNLSYVERYFADFLSVMESKETIPLYSEDMEIYGLPPALHLPQNLFIIGTVNIDETTNMFSPKVLDRANTIEFRVTEKEMEGFLADIKEINMESLYTKGAGMAKSFLEMSENKSFATEDIEEINKTLIRFFGELKKTGAEFGYRSATEILRLINQLTLVDNTLTINQKLDIAIMQKLLPKLHGSRRKLCPVLSVLGSFCFKEDVKIEKDVFDKDEFDFENSNVLFPLSLEKITRMYRGAIDNGFASFAEA